MPVEDCSYPRPALWAADHLFVNLRGFLWSSGCWPSSDVDTDEFRPAVHIAERTSFITVGLICIRLSTYASRSLVVDPAADLHCMGRLLRVHRVSRIGPRVSSRCVLSRVSAMGTLTHFRCRVLTLGQFADVQGARRRRVARDKAPHGKQISLTVSSWTRSSFRFLKTALQNWQLIGTESLFRRLDGNTFGTEFP